jgi:hypothetical protein
MGILLILLEIIIAYWLIFSLFAYYHVDKAFSKYRSHQKIDTPENWNAFIRTDFNKWN